MRGGAAVRPSDTFAVLVTSDAGEDAVHVVSSGEEGAPGANDSFFYVVTLWVEADGRPSTVVSPFSVASHGAWRLDASGVLHLPMSRAVRKALAVHDCTSVCCALATGRVCHDDTNSWVVYGREHGLSPRQG